MTKHYVNIFKGEMDTEDEALIPKKQTWVKRLTNIFDAAADLRKLVIIYTKVNGKTVQRRVAPYEIKDGYLWATCDTHGGRIHKFKLGGINRVEVSEHGYKPKFEIRLSEKQTYTLVKGNTGPGMDFRQARTNFSAELENTPSPKDRQRAHYTRDRRKKETKSGIVDPRKRRMNGRGTQDSFVHRGEE